jgi:predicted metalloprotease with PDZ domain
MTGLPEVKDGTPHHYRAPDFDTLVDSPIVAGNPEIHEFEVDGKTHDLVNTPPAPEFDGARTAADIKKIVDVNRKFWDSRRDKYRFQHDRAESGRAEHKNSQHRAAGRRRPANSAISASSRSSATSISSRMERQAAASRRAGPVRHCSVRSIRRTCDFEGLTDYYGDVRCAHGDSHEQEFRHPLRRHRNCRRRPDGSCSCRAGAFTRGSKPTGQTRTPNTSISYYTKGEVSFILDAKVRRATNDGKSLTR